MAESIGVNKSLCVHLTHDLLLVLKNNNQSFLYGKRIWLIVTNLPVGLRPLTHREGEVPTLRLKSRTYSLLGEQELQVKGDTPKLSPPGRESNHGPLD